MPSVKKITFSSAFSRRWAAFAKAGREALPEFEIAKNLDEQERDVFISHVVDAVKALPLAVRFILAESGQRVRLARRMADVDPDSAARRSSDGSLTFDFKTLAYYSEDDKCLTILQQQRISPYVPDGEVVYQKIDPGKLKGFFNHESGHAFDESIKKFSQRKEFRSAYEEDVLNLKRLKIEKIDDVDYYVLQQTEADNQRETKVFPVDNLLYFLDKKSGGSQPTRYNALREVFAEIFAGTVGEAYYGINDLFPRSTEVMKELLRSIEFEVAALYDPDAFLATHMPKPQGGQRILS